jgi:hypothetical protein
MTLQNFYDILDKELDAVIADNPKDEALQKGGIEQRKARAFLIWFLQFYGKKSIYNSYITDGTDDTSCDIIFPTHDSVGKKIMYVVQSKWCARKNCIDETKAKEFKATLDDFKLIYSSQKEIKSEKNKTFNEQYQAIKQHLAENNAIKFIYLTLNQNNPILSENIDLFGKQFGDIEVIDIERLKRDFIEVEYKGIQPENPLEYNYEAESDTIILPIEQLETERNFLSVKGSAHDCYIFLVRPKAIFDLFEKYRFKLFFNNIRNPFIESEYNRQLSQTLREAPDVFFYYNNGITAITRQIPKKIHGAAKQIEIAGLQIINGAQTVYAIHKAYKEANGKRIALNQAMVMFRLVESVNREFDLNITRFTNQQNPTEPRDFWVNDPVQIRLQNESFKTNYWYSVRRNEFPKVPENTVKIIPSSEFILAYLDFWGDKNKVARHEEGIWTRLNNTLKTTGWTGYKGVYELYFNENTEFIDLLVAYRTKELLHPKIEALDLELDLLNDVRLVLTALFGKDLNALILDKLKFNTDFLYKVLAFVVKGKMMKKSNKPISIEDFESSTFITKEIIDAVDWESILK